MSMIVSSFLIGSSSNLQVNRTCIKSQTSLNSGQIRPVTLELLANFANLQYVSSGFHCRVIAGSLMRLY